MSRPPSPELRVLLALDELRDALGAVFAAREPERGSPRALLTLTAAAAELGVARSTVTRWADAGRIVTVGPRNARRVPAGAIAEYVAAQSSGPASDLRRAGRECPGDAGDPAHHRGTAGRRRSETPEAA